MVLLGGLASPWPFVQHVALADEGQPAVWYRYSGDCPTGEEFLARLEAQGLEARLAGVQDSVDFVVTMGSSDGRSQGRLERQTAAGIVAIRDVEAAGCASVADALALTLVLTLNPEAGAKPSASGETVLDTPLPVANASAFATPPNTAEADPGIAPAGSSSGAAASTARPDKAAVAGDAVSPTPATPGRDASEGAGSQRYPRLRLGAEAGAAWGVAPELLPGGGVFLGYRPEGLHPRVEWRATVMGGYGQSETATGDLRVQLGALRLEGCGLGWGRGPLGIEPCAGLELGLISAKNQSSQGLSDSGPWATARVHGRGFWQLGQGFGLEVRLGGFVPWFRYAYSRAGGGYTAYQTKAVGVDAALGAFLTLD